MFETITIISVIIALGASVAAAYLLADSLAAKRFIVKQDEIIQTLRTDLREWQNKALIKNNHSVLGFENKTRPPQKEQSDRFLPFDRAKAQADAITPSEPLTYKQVNTQETVEKAEEILKKNV
jgi:hypothetical protein